ncbi:hypothetical protein EVG20_g9831 [Dentipellis fragilis]|uniref:DNA polymerase delta subunit 4 n=1 Tax=Dentipellis fragilis TaxID=205917 RepID=A0A4Y9XYB2_9AGAM|nr:hypothetical protein EVG20_g9831 [Dentipellis fragilis]
MATTKQPRRSNSSTSAKQGTLPFASVKRTSSATTAGTKSKQSLTPSAKRPINIRTLSGGSPVKPTAKDAEADDGAAPTKKRKLGADEAEVEIVVSETELAREAVSRPTDVVEIPPPAKRERLDPEDKRWRKALGEARSKMGNLAPVHAEEQKSVHHILRVFDLSYEYGPCVGVSRLERWERAEALGLNPPVRGPRNLVDEGWPRRRAVYAMCILWRGVKLLRPFLLPLAFPWLSCSVDSLLRIRVELLSVLYLGLSFLSTYFTLVECALSPFTSMISSLSLYGHLVGEDTTITRFDTSRQITTSSLWKRWEPPVSLWKGPGQASCIHMHNRATGAGLRPYADATGRIR